MRASITEGVQDVAVISGDPATFFCSAVGSDVDTQWTLDDAEYEECPSREEADICFENSYVSDTVTTRSTLIIANSSSLGQGSHTVQCIVEQNLDPGFGTNLFLESRTATLHIGGSPSFLFFLSSFSL